MNQVDSSFHLRPYFLRSDYMQGNSRTGVLSSKSSKRLLVLPEDLIFALHKTIEFQAGDASSVILYNCGKRWGERLVKGWEKEWRYFYDTAIVTSRFSTFQIWLEHAFFYYGWGGVDLDFSLSREGLVQVFLDDSIFVELLKDLSSERVCHIFAGLISALFSHFSNRNVDAIELACAKDQDIERCHFVVANPKLIEQARQKQLERSSWKEILASMRMN